MSENFLRLIPTDPVWVPDDAAAAGGLAALRLVAPDADEYRAERCDSVVFVDPGSNFEELGCPHCGRLIDFDWFAREMDRPTFDDLSATTPCCAMPLSLNDLDFRWPAGFASFMLEARSPGRMQLAAEERDRVAVALGHAVREIWAHL